ncbi:alanine racemase [Brucella tritici]|uniref:Alanine racemase n=1 Tax=Brucella tritici TaxID=94626 RepID=A0A6L3YMQ0_9HYPH|nr:alanine racemase [Brucella tritici]KAB2684366.1 alanine racemase [Brucella tritici]
MNETPQLECTSVVRISLPAVSENFTRISAALGPAECGSVIKADAYGLGDVLVARTLSLAGCRVFFVATFNEAVRIRSALPVDAAIYILNGISAGLERECHELGLKPVINSIDQAVSWAESCKITKRASRAALQIDTGMARMGISLVELTEAQRSGLLSQFKLDLVMSHLAVADEPHHPGNAAQLDAFREASRYFHGTRRSLANSAGIFLGRDYHFDLCRAGAALYGMNISPLMPPLSSAIQLHACVIQVRTVPAGSYVGYGWTFATSRETRLATVALGYADGLSRIASNNAALWFGNQRLPVVGRISMDSLTIDITDAGKQGPGPGDYVEVIGPHQTVEEIAGMSSTINYEILAGLGPRISRLYVD